MTSLSSLALSQLRAMRAAMRRRRLEAGEAGWGKPLPQAPMIPAISAGKSARVAVIGAGRQGLAQCEGFKAIKGVEIVGLADLNAESLRACAKKVGLPASALFEDAETMLREAAPIDLVCVATTAPSHIALGYLALKAGVKRILLEKPMATSLREARAFADDCRAANVSLAINHSRRWSLDYRGIKRCIARNTIGEPRSIAITIGKGELGMHATHYFDVCRYLLDSDPAWLMSHLDPVGEVNIRGAQYHDPSGHCLIGFQNGARVFVDFSADLGAKDPYLTIKGTLGRITIDELRGTWSLQSRSQRVWEFQFAEQFKSSVLFSRVAADLLSDAEPASNGDDGVMALEMVVAAHLSHDRRGQQINFPVPDTEADVELKIA